LAAGFSASNNVICERGSVKGMPRNLSGPLAPAKLLTNSLNHLAHVNRHRKVPENRRFSVSFDTTKHTF
jgi:hypothetical protein